MLICNANETTKSNSLFMGRCYKSEMALFLIANYENAQSHVISINDKKKPLVFTRRGGMDSSLLRQRFLTVLVHTIAPIG
jgi:hypothetical protein